MIKICKHTRYKARKAPRVACEYCWYRWFTEGPGRVHFLDVSPFEEMIHG